jgi:hypothetical protein
MIMTPRLRTFALTAHGTSSVGWLGVVVASLARFIAALTSQDTQRVRAAWVAMELTTWFVIVPLSLAALRTGLVQALGTTWGLFRHSWILCKLLRTVFATSVLLRHMPLVSSMAGVAVETDSAHLGRLLGELLHAGGGLLVLLVTTTLSVYKPRGLTPYGWRQHAQRALSPPEVPDVTAGRASEGAILQPRRSHVAAILITLIERGRKANTYLRGGNAPDK